MSATTVRNALIAQIQGDAALITEFGSGNIKKGVETRFDLKVSSKGVRVGTELSRQRTSDLTSNGKIDARYGFGVLAYFYEDDPGKVDDRMTLYDELIREAIEKDLTLGVGVLDLDIGQTRYRVNASIPNLFYCYFPVLCWVREIRGNR